MPRTTDARRDDNDQRPARGPTKEGIDAAKAGEEMPHREPWREEDAKRGAKPDDASFRDQEHLTVDSS